MQSELVPIGGLRGGLERRESRALSRNLSAIEMSRSVNLAKIELQAQIEVAKVHAVGYVGQQAMQAVAMVSQMEGQLGQACPLAVTRLQGIADMTALSVAQVVADTARKLG